MAINKKLIHFNKLADFESRLAANEILDTSIVFIKDAKKIYTHGTFYDGNTVDLSNIESSIQNILQNKQDNIEDLETIRENAAKGASALQSYEEHDPVFTNSAAYNIIESDINNWNNKPSSIAYPLINYDTTNTTAVINSNTFYVWGIVSSLSLTFNSQTSGVCNEYIFQFTSNADTTLSLPSTIKWAYNEPPIIEANKTYQISIINNLATFLVF